MLLTERARHDLAAIKVVLESSFTKWSYSYFLPTSSISYRQQLITDIENEIPKAEALGDDYNTPQNSDR